MKYFGIHHKARDNMNLSYTHQSTASCSYNVYEQNQAIRSAEQQVSIANSSIKQATADLTNRVAALSAVVDDYFTRINRIALSSAAPKQKYRLTDSKDQYSSLRSHQSSSAASASSAADDKVLISMKSGNSTIYSLVNRKHR